MRYGLFQVISSKKIDDVLVDGTIIEFITTLQYGVEKTFKDADTIHSKAKFIGL